MNQNSALKRVLHGLRTRADMRKSLADFLMHVAWGGGASTTFVEYVFGGRHVLVLAIIALWFLSFVIMSFIVRWADVIWPPRGG